MGISIITSKQNTHIYTCVYNTVYTSTVLQLIYIYVCVYIYLYYTYYTVIYIYNIYTNTHTYKYIYTYRSLFERYLRLALWYCCALRLRAYLGQAGNVVASLSGQRASWPRCGSKLDEHQDFFNAKKMGTPWRFNVVSW
jgi:hypothetical protein